MNTAKTKDAIRKLLRTSKTPPTSKNQIVDLVSAQRKVVLKALHEMEQAGEVSQEDKKKPFTLVEETSEED